MAIKDSIENAATVVGLISKVVGCALIAWVIYMGTAGMRMENDLENIEAQAAAAAARMEEVQRQQAREYALAREGWGSATSARSVEFDAYAEARAEAERRALQRGATTAEMAEEYAALAEHNGGYAIR